MMHHVLLMIADEGNRHRWSLLNRIRKLKVIQVSKTDATIELMVGQWEIVERNQKKTLKIKFLITVNQLILKFHCVA